VYHLSAFLYLQIDGKTVKDLDHSLFVEDEIRTVFEELMKTMPKDHLKTNLVCNQVNAYWLVIVAYNEQAYLFATEAKI